MSSPENQLYEFGPYVMDARSRILLKDGATVRDVYRRQWSNLRTSRQVEQALAVLSDAGWVRVESVATSGRPTEVIHIHPAIHEGEKKA